MNMFIFILGVLALYGGIVLYSAYSNPAARKELKEYAEETLRSIKEDCKRK